MVYDPQILRSIANPGAPVAGAPVPPSDVPPAAPPQQSEPAVLCELAQKADAAVKAAREALDELTAQAEMSEMIDPSIEKVIVAAAESIAEIDDGIGEACEALEESLEEHEAAVEGDDDDDPYDAY